MRDRPALYIGDKVRVSVRVVTADGADIVTSRIGQIRAIEREDDHYVVFVELLPR